MDFSLLGLLKMKYNLLRTGQTKVNLRGFVGTEWSTEASSQARSSWAFHSGNGDATSVLCPRADTQATETLTLVLKAPTAHWGRQTPSHLLPDNARMWTLSGGIVWKHRRGGGRLSDGSLEGMAGPFISSHLRGAPFTVEVS